MSDPKERAALLPGLACGVGILAAWLTAWRLLTDAAGWFAPATAIFSLCGLLLASQPLLCCRPVWRIGLRVAGATGCALAIAAALSLGGFLPASVAGWISPPLGRFGGAPALALLALAAFVTGRARRPALLLDAATFCGLASGWVWSQTRRQATFPTPPTILVLAPRVLALRALALAGFTLVVVLAWRQQTAGTTLWRQWAWRWGGVALLLGLALALFTHDWRQAGLFALPVLVGLVGMARLGRWRGGARALWPHIGRGAAWLATALGLLAIIYGATTEDLEVVLLRNTVEHHATAFWRGYFGDERATRHAPGAFAGMVRAADGRPLAGASVVVAGADGQPYSAVSDAAGRYQLAGMPAGNYLPLAVAPGYQQGAVRGLGGRVVTVRAGRTAGGVDFALRPRPPFDPSVNESLHFGPPTEVTIDSLQPSTVIRREFTFENKGKVLDGGLVHEPRPELGAGPFPILLIIYPGEAKDWEGVSAPLAAEGFVVVSYFPRRLLDLNGDLDDLRLLLNLTTAGRLSARGDGHRVAILGGSVSTVYTYLLLREIAGTPARASVRAAVQYGGLFDLFAFRQSWEAGKVIIDPGISGLEYLLIAFGTPRNQPELYLRFSPRYGLNGDSLPPTLLVHAGKDIIVPVDQSHLADATFTELGLPHELLIYPDLEHYLDVSQRDPEQLDMLHRTVAFLKIYLGP
ncbi:MAG: carboxypeptidase regulatory-like domain-containing protein [Thermomicrobiales bacterium]